MIPAGTEIRDAGGNLIVTIVEDIHPGDDISAFAFRLPNGEHPMPGDNMPDEVVEFFTAHGLAPM